MSERIERLIPFTYDKNGNPVWHARTSPPDNSCGVMHMVPDRIIPVIFVPGIMGSNLVEKNPQSKADAVTWRLDDESSAGRWFWFDRGAKFRKRYLRPDVMTVDRDGAIPAHTHFAANSAHLRDRGWGEVGAMSYASFLVWLDLALNDFEDPMNGERAALMRENLGAVRGESPLTKEEFALGYRYRFPVWACGYNWLDDNAESAKRLAQRIQEAIDFYKKQRLKCEKVIIVTHSMGGLVARYCAKADGLEGKILGIVHGVMPATGAAAVYRRMKAGTESGSARPYTKEGIVGLAAASSLGNDASEMTAVLSSAPGALQLLPTSEYGNGWLTVRSGTNEIPLPAKGDPYSEIYTKRDKWWSLCETELINPLNEEKHPNKRRKVLEGDWETFVKLINVEVKGFHKSIMGQYHKNTYLFYGNSPSIPAYGQVMWRGSLPASRVANVLDAQHVPDQPERGMTRSVAGMLPGSRATYTISEPDEPGDGTVPQRSGRAPWDACQSVLTVEVGHEPAFRDSMAARRFTLRSIVRIAQAVQDTTLRYEC